MADFIVVTTPVIQTITADVPVIETLTSIQQGPPGPPGTGAFAYAFSWGDATPALIMTAAALTTIIKTEVVLLTPFNAEALLSIGDSADHESLFATGNIDLSVAGTWQANNLKICAGNTAINLYMTLVGNVSAGNGLIFLYFEE